MSDGKVIVLTKLRRWVSHSLSLREAHLYLVGKTIGRIRESRRNQSRRSAREAAPRRTPLSWCRSLQASGAGRSTGHAPQQRDEKSPQSRGAPQSWNTKASSEQRGTESESCSTASTPASDEREMVMSEGPHGTAVAGPDPEAFAAWEAGRDE